MYTGAMWPNYKCTDCFSYYCATKLLTIIWYIAIQDTYIYIYNKKFSSKKLGTM